MKYVKYAQCVLYVHYVQYIQYVQHVHYAQYVQYSQYIEYAHYIQYANYVQQVQYSQYVHYAQHVYYVQYIQYEVYAHYEQINLRYITPISLLLSNKSIPPQITDATDRQTSVPSAARSTDCVDNASGSVQPVAQWTWYVHAVCCSGQTARTSGKGWFVGRFMLCTVHHILLE